MNKIVLNIDGMTCSACSNGLEKYLKKQIGIIDVSVNLVMATALIEYDEKKISKKDLDNFVEEAGFKSLGEDKSQNDKKTGLFQLIFFCILAVILMYISMGNMLNFPLPNCMQMSNEMNISNVTTMPNELENHNTTVMSQNVIQIQNENKFNPILYVIIVVALTVPFLIYGFDIIKNGIKNIIHKMPNMDSLVGIGVCVNFAYSAYNSILVFLNNENAIHNLYFEASAMIILFVKIGRFIDKKNKARAVDTIKNLVTITPKNGTIIENGKEKIVTINEIKVGDIVVCKPGEKIAVDGTITKGETHTDESFITGESKPVSKNVGSKVIAGSINYDGYIEYSAEKIGKDSSISNIVKLVVEATNTKAPIARLADKISGYFVPIIFAVALISFILNLIILKDVTKAVTAFVSVLVVACPCALGLATPLAMVVSIGKCSKNGILVKSSESLEAINKIDTVVFDKTGTLTKGKMTIVEAESLENDNVDLQIKILQSLEAKSNHPLAKSICNYKVEGKFNRNNKIKEKYNVKNNDKDEANVNEKENIILEKIYNVTEFKEISGYGIQGIINEKIYYAGNKKFVQKISAELQKQNVIKYIDEYSKIEDKYAKKGESIVYLFNEEKILVIVGLADEIKPSAITMIKRLNEEGKKIIMLTGDNKISAEAIAKKMGINEVISNVTPKEKLEKIKQLNTNKNCAMVGDGINDSPALKTASIGISVSGGTDISADSADIILLNDDMNKIYDLFETGKNTIKIIKQNLFWALIYNICMIPLATGLFPVSVNPMIASIAMTSSSLTVVINSLRLMK